MLPFNPKLIVFDFDGVFTNNKVLVFQDGKEAVLCDRGDGMGIDLLKNHGYDMMVLSKETNPVVLSRTKKLNIACYHGVENKLDFLIKLLEKKKISSKETYYVGNDVNDVDCMNYVGFSACPADAHPSANETADLILQNNGGDGAVREICDLILETYFRPD